MRRALFVAVVLALLAAPHALAQVPVTCTAPAIVMDASELRLAPGARGTVNVTVTNRNAISASASVLIEVPVGFVADPSDAELASVPGGGEGTILVAVTALESATPGSTGQVVGRASFTCGPAQLQQRSATADTSADLVVTEAPAGPVDGFIGFIRSPTVLAATGLALVLLVGAVALRGRREGFLVACAEPTKTVKPGRGTSFPVHVENRGTSPDTTTFVVGDVPAGWTAFMAVPELKLAPKEDRTVWLMVRAPPAAKPGESVKIGVQASSAEHPSRTGSVEVTALVEAEGQA